MSKPYVGAVVHYRDQFLGEGERAAIIIEVHDETWVGLQVFAKRGGMRYVSHAEHGKTWSWIKAPTESQIPASGWESLS